jgi:hypothetical protein
VWAHNDRERAQTVGGGQGSPREVRRLAGGAEARAGGMSAATAARPSPVKEGGLVVKAVGP